MPGRLCGSHGVAPCPGSRRHRPPEVASAGRAFEQLSANVVTEKKADNFRIDSLYSATPKRPAIMREAPAEAAAPVASMQDVARGNIQAGGKDKNAGVTATPEAKLRVLKREGAYVRVRDTSGNEGWIDADAL